MPPRGTSGGEFQPASGVSHIDAARAILDDWECQKRQAQLEEERLARERIEQRMEIQRKEAAAAAGLAERQATINEAMEKAQKEAEEMMRKLLQKAPSRGGRISGSCCKITRGS